MLSQNPWSMAGVKALPLEGSWSGDRDAALLLGRPGLRVESQLRLKHLLDLRPCLSLPYLVWSAAV